MFCTRLAANTGRKNYAKYQHLRTIAPLCWASLYFQSSQLRHLSTIRNKPVKQQYLPHVFPQYGGHRPTDSWDRFGSLGYHSKFQRVSRLGLVTAATSLTGDQPNLARRLVVSLAGTLFIQFWGLLPLMEFCQVQSSLSVSSLAFSYNGSVNARHSSTGVSQNLQRATKKERNYGTFTEGARALTGYHVGHRPTFYLALFLHCTLLSLDIMHFAIKHFQR